MKIEKKNYRLRVKVRGKSYIKNKIEKITNISW